MEVARARIGDATTMHQMINHFAEQGDMLPRALSQIYENIRDYFVAKQGDRIIGCVALHVNWIDLAEVRSLAVDLKSQKQEIGSLLVDACINEARELGLSKVFCLTYKQAFFEKQGFHLVDKMELPHKIWAECYNCPKFPNCDEVALIRQI